jgi:hypothetical protein
MGISDLCLGAPRGLFSTQDYNEAIQDQRRFHEELRDKEGLVCECGVKYHPDIDHDHHRSLLHRRFFEGVLCECGAKYHPQMERYAHYFCAAHQAYENTRIPCECGGSVQRKRFPTHVASKTHMLRVRRRVDAKRVAGQGSVLK